jgi:hypothetical protein
MFAFSQMNRRLTLVPTGDLRPWTEQHLSEAEAIAIVNEAADLRPIWNADKLANYLGLTYRDRTACKIKTIGACDFAKRFRTAQRKHKKRMAQEKRRRALGMRPQCESLSATKPWEKEGMSRATWYRQNKARMRRETVLYPITFLIPEDRPVSPARGAGLSEVGFASKQARGLPSSRTATTMAADDYGSLPMELRLMALGLPLPEPQRAAA